MSSASVTSSKREMVTSEMALEIDAIRAMNSSLQAYLDHLRAFKKNLIAMNDNCKQLSKVNQEWVDTLNNMKR